MCLCCRKVSTHILYADALLYIDTDIDDWLLHCKLPTRLCHTVGRVCRHSLCLACIDACGWCHQLSGTELVVMLCVECLQ